MEVVSDIGSMSATIGLFGEMPRPSAAAFSPCRTYRYTLTRTWDERLLTCCFVMLNPSTADADVDDPTIRRCIGFAKQWGFGRLVVVNLFAFRATDSSRMWAAPDPVGPYNDTWTQRAIGASDRVVCAWGNGSKGVAKPLLAKRAAHVLKLIKPHVQPVCFRKLASGMPEHPLYQPASRVPVPYE